VPKIRGSDGGEDVDFVLICNFFKKNITGMFIYNIKLNPFSDFKR
jgi:hypothetical protein